MSVDKIFTLDFRMFVYNAPHDIDFEVMKKDGNAILWSFNTDGFGLYLTINNEGLGVDIEFTPEQQAKIRPVIEKLWEWNQKYGEEL